MQTSESECAKNFENLDCVRCADALVDAFKSEGITGQIITLQSKQTKRGFIWSTSADKIIATSGMHRGVLDDGKVYDNIHKSGIDLNDWINDFVVLGGFEIPSISSF